MDARRERFALRPRRGGRRRPDPRGRRPPKAPPAPRRPERLGFRTGAARTFPAPSPPLLAPSQEPVRHGGGAQGRLGGSGGSYALPRQAQGRGAVHGGSGCSSAEGGGSGGPCAGRSAPDDGLCLASHLPPRPSFACLRRRQRSVRAPLEGGGGGPVRLEPPRADHPKRLGSPGNAHP